MKFLQRQIESIPYTNIDRQTHHKNLNSVLQGIEIIIECLERTNYVLKDTWRCFVKGFWYTFNKRFVLVLKFYSNVFSGNELLTMSLHKNHTSHYSTAVILCAQYYSDVIMGAKTSNHQPHDCLLNRLFRRGSKKTSKFSVTGLCEGKSSVTGEFPAKRASNAENVSIWWRHHGLVMFVCMKAKQNLHQHKDTTAWY